MGHHYFNDSSNPERNEFYCHITPFTNPFDGFGGYTLNYFADKHKATIVLAAGNDNMLAGLDAFHRPKNFIVVSALDKEGGLVNKAEFSNYGQYSTISAPGVDIFSSFGASGYESNEDSLTI